jgi:hypothetical protein
MVLYNLGSAYERGSGVVQDWAKAVHFYRLAAEQGLHIAQFALGVCYECGKGVAQDAAEGVRYNRLDRHHRNNRLQLGTRQRMTHTEFCFPGWQSRQR